MMSLYAILMVVMLQVMYAAASRPVPPSRDSFYTAPEGFQRTAPGTILRKRQAPGNLTQVFNCSAAYNIVYRTTGARHEPSWAVTTVFVPLQNQSEALLSYQIPYNTINVDQSPSYALYKPEPGYLSDITAALSKGWFVAVPDHEGPNVTFGAAVGDGFATLDSLRAVLKGVDGLHKDARYALWGYSAGALASEAATELQVLYAPELHISGAALGGVPANLTAIYDTGNANSFAGFIVFTLLGLANEYPEINHVILSHLKTEGAYNKTGFLAAKTLDPATAFGVYFHQNIWEYFDVGHQIMNEPAIVEAVNNNFYMGYQGTPKVPFFMYQAIGDDATPIATTDALVKRYCGVGADIVFERNTVGKHADEQASGVKRALEWLTRVLDGTLDQKGCIIRDVTVRATAAGS